MKTISTFEGLKVKLRGIHNEKDLDTVWNWMNDVEVTQYLMTLSPMSFAYEKEYFSKVGLDPNHKKFAIEDKKTGEFIGVMDLTKINFLHRHATTGSVIGNKTYWGKGFGSDAKMLVLNYAFNTLNLKNVFSEVYNFNKRSLGALRKTGYQVIGKQKKSVYCNGQWHDKLLLCVTRKRFNKLWKRYGKELKVGLSKQSQEFKSICRHKDKQL